MGWNLIQPAQKISRIFLDLACRKSLLHKDLLAEAGLEPARGLLHTGF